MPERTIGTHLYIGYPTYLSIPKPERYRTFFILRDPRDVSVSWYFAARYAHGALDPIPRLRKDLKNLGLQDGLRYSIDSLEEFGLFWAQRSWMNVEQDGDRIRIFRYEDFSKDNRAFLADLLGYMGVALPEADFAPCTRGTRSSRSRAGAKPGSKTSTITIARESPATGGTTSTTR